MVALLHDLVITAGFYGITGFEITPAAVIGFLTAFIPLIGATIAVNLAALVALVANGPLVALIVVAIVIVVNQIEGDLLNPVVMAGALKLHPLVILVALTVGTILGGIAGAVLAVPLVAVGWAMIKVWDRPDQSITQRAKFSIRHWPQPAKPAEAAPLSARGGEPTIDGI